jgi:BolA family transcriptional regulator, general stress-responsive regulator
VTAHELHRLLVAALAPGAPEDVTVEDDSARHAGHAGAREGRHFNVAIRSARFEGLKPLARHRLVYDALGPLSDLGIHALAIEARAPGER